MTTKSDNDTLLIELIDKLAPLNNKFRLTTNAIDKIEIMWELGKVLDEHLREHKHNLKLHELLYKIYDPHSTLKVSNITRDVGSYGYRIYKNFRSKEEIQRILNGLQSYTLFREAMPLLFNPKYNLSDKERSKIIRLITSSGNEKWMKERIRSRKKDIIPFNNPRNQRAKDYQKEKFYLQSTFEKLKTFYQKHPTLPRKSEVDSSFGKIEQRTVFVAILMAMASESFLKKIHNINQEAMDAEQKKLLSIVNSKSRDRARFRKWVMSSSDLLKLAEAIHSLGDESFYSIFRKKFVSNE